MFYQSRMKLKSSKCSISLSYIRFCVHDRFRGCGLGVVNIIWTSCLSELSIFPRGQRDSDNQGWTVVGKPPRKRCTETMYTKRAHLGVWWNCVDVIYSSSEIRREDQLCWKGTEKEVKVWRSVHTLHVQYTCTLNFWKCFVEYYI